MSTKVAPKGAGVFIWEPWNCDGGDWQKIIVRLVDARMSWVALHNFYSKAAVAELREAGLYVAYSQYVTPSTANAGVASALSALQAGVDGLLLDMEIEWDSTNADGYAQKRDAAIVFLSKLRTAVGNMWIGNAGAWAFPQSHPWYPDTVIARYVDAALPERYWTEQLPTMTAKADLDGSEAQWASYSDVKGYPAVIPIGSGYGTNTSPSGGRQELSGTDFSGFVERYPTFAIWSYMHMPEWAWMILKNRTGVQV